MELCMDLGQAHLGGVFWILETGALLGFCSTAKMTATTSLLHVAMVWCDEPIRLHTCPPLTPISELMWLIGACIPPGPKPQLHIERWCPSHLLGTITLREALTFFPYGP